MITQTNILKAGLGIVIFGCALNGSKLDPKQPIAEGTYKITNVKQGNATLKDVKGTIVVDAGKNTFYFKEFTYKTAKGKTYDWKFNVDFGEDKTDKYAFTVGLKTQETKTKENFKVRIPLSKKEANDFKSALNPIDLVTELELEDEKQQMQSSRKIERLAEAGRIYKLEGETLLQIGLKITYKKTIDLKNNTNFINAISHLGLRQVIKTHLNPIANTPAKIQNINNILETFRKKLKTGIITNEKFTFTAQQQK